jgi:hypothetical protein
MKKFLVLMMAVMLPFTAMNGKKKEKQNIMVWGEVVTAADSLDYLTMYKNCPAEVTAQFHFLYQDNSKSDMYDLFMPDTVAQVNDPAPVEKPVKEVVVDNIVYSAVDSDGKKYSTSDPDDPMLAYLLVDMFDLYHDIFWFDAIHRAHYYHDRNYDRWTPNTSRYRQTHGRSSAPDINLDKVDDAALLIGAAAVAVASTGMLIAVVKNWDKPDDRFPYFSLSPQVQFFTQSGTMRDVLQLKCRFGNYGGFSILADLGYTTGSLNDDNLFDPGFTWSLGAGLDIGAFSLSFRGKPATRLHSENFFNCELGYDIFLTKNLAVDLKGGVALIDHDSELYWDIPVSVGLLWKF